jgi:hypothetical protein
MNYILKPCPFCGSKAQIVHIPENTPEENARHPNWEWKNPGMFVVGCFGDLMCMGNINHVTMIFSTEEEAVKTWNRRETGR